MNSDDIFLNAASTPNDVHATISSGYTSKYYNLSQEQNALYEKLKDINRTNYVKSYISSFLGFALSGICVILLFFQSTRKNAFIALCIIIPVWFGYVYYLTIEGNTNADKMDALLKPLEVSII